MQGKDSNPFESDLVKLLGASPTEGLPRSPSINPTSAATTPHKGAGGLLQTLGLGGGGPKGSPFAAETTAPWGAAGAGAGSVGGAGTDAPPPLVGGTPDGAARSNVAAEVQRLLTVGRRMEAVRVRDL